VPTNRLNDKTLRSLRPPAKPRKHFDGHGLYLLHRPTGSKTWQVAYRLHGKLQTATLGPYPEVTLSEAREKRDRLRKLLRDGVDPRRTARDTEAPQPPAAPTMTLRSAAMRYLDGRRDLSESYRSNARRGIEFHLSGLLDRPIKDIDRATLLAELLKLDAAGKHVYAKRVLMWARHVWEWAVEHPEQTGCAINPAASINPGKAFGKAAVRSHAALRPSEVPEFMQRLAAEDQNLLSVVGCRMLAMTWVRTKELRLMKWSQLEEDGSMWRLPAANMKKGNEHLVPLSRQARAILDALRARSRSEYVFPCESGRRRDRPMSENSILYLIGRIGFKGRMTGHGWRSVASTWAHESGSYHVDAIERQLAHTPASKDKVRMIYNRSQYLEVRRRMMQEWADWLEKCERGGSHDA
jgi:integrase